MKLVGQYFEEAVDLFCGAGGTSTGVLEAAAELGLNLRLTAVNHWDTAINSHSLNHPDVFHICEPVENLWPPRVIKRRRLRLLCASCECTFHSIARGGGPCNEQSRSQPWQIIRWATDLDIEDILMENVKEWRHWGPLLTRALRWRGKYYKKGSPDPRHKGEFFNAFINALRNLGYAVEWRLQNAADFGDATNRVRLILIARKRRPIVWPEATHGPGRAQPYRTARQIIDWSLPGQSIFQRKRPLSPNTMARIEAGLRKFGGAAAEPFILMMRGTSDAHLNNSKSVNEPLDTITTSGKHHYLAEPFVIGQQSCAAPRSVQTPLPTVAQAGAIALVEPVIVQTDQTGGGASGYSRSVNDPIPTVVSKQNLALVEPFIVKANHGKNGHRPEAPGQRVYPVSEPLKTVTARNGYGVCSPCLVNMKGKSKAASIDNPIPTQTTKPHQYLVEPVLKSSPGAGCAPYLVKYYGTATAVGVDQPLDTVTCKDRFLLIEPQTGNVVAELDIRFRMLQPHELAAAHSFPKQYQLTGTKEDQTAQIGNSVPVKLAKAHALALLN